MYRSGSSINIRTLNIETFVIIYKFCKTKLHDSKLSSSFQSLKPLLSKFVRFIPVVRWRNEDASLLVNAANFLVAVWVFYTTVFLQQKFAVSDLFFFRQLIDLCADQKTNNYHFWNFRFVSNFQGSIKSRRKKSFTVEFSAVVEKAKSIFKSAVNSIMKNNCSTFLCTVAIYNFNL